MIPIIKKINTDTIVPLPLLKNDPRIIKRKIIEEDKTLKWIPIIEPIIKKIIINIVLPNAKPKYEPTNAIYNEEYIIDKFVDTTLSKNLTLKR